MCVQGPSLTHVFLLILQRFSDFAPGLPPLSHCGSPLFAKSPKNKTQRCKYHNTANAMITDKWKEDWETKSPVQQTISEDEKVLLVEHETKLLSSLMWNTMNSIGLPSISPKKGAGKWKQVLQAVTSMVREVGHLIPKMCWECQVWSK